MRLAKARITEFQSVHDSTEFSIGPVTCLVGKNEAGKTALLQALAKLRPVDTKDGAYDPVRDYPRWSFGAYERHIAEGKCQPAIVAEASYELQPEDIDAVRNIYGPSCLIGHSPYITLKKGYANQLFLEHLETDTPAALLHLVGHADLPQQTASELRELSTAADMLKVLSDAEQTDAVESLTPIVKQIADRGLRSCIFREVLDARIPRFLYFDEYYQMKGQDNIDSLLERVKSKELEESDYPLLGLIDLAGLSLQQLIDAEDTETIIARLEAAGNQLTQSVLRYWSQNRHIRMKFDIRPARPQDGPGMDEGTNIWGRVEDTQHMVTTPLRTRSRGFVWFFSFLAWYSQIRKEQSNLILLLDEPGLSLHAKAQADLLRYFEQELAPHHQLLYTTHSPFMVDSSRFDRVRIVQDLSIDAEPGSLEESQRGTKVTTEVLEATSDSLFPLQGALGYEIHQTLFVGPNSLVVEGASDLLYIQTMSAILQSRGKPGLNAHWTITPVGGAGNIPTFVALVGARTTLNVAVLIDFQKKGQQSIENLYKSKLLEKQQVLTFTQFTGTFEADIEDMFDEEFYLRLVNGEFGSSTQASELSTEHPRILYKLEEHFKNQPLPKNQLFNHYRPARYFSEKATLLEPELSEDTLNRFQRAFDALNALI